MDCKQDPFAEFATTIGDRLARVSAETRALTSQIVRDSETLARQCECGLCASHGSEEGWR